MTQATIRTAVYNAVNGVADIGLVYDYERYANEWDKFLDLFKTTIDSTVQIRGWTVGYGGFPVAPERAEFDPRYLRGHVFTVRGYLGLDDSAETEKTAAALAETVANALHADSTLQDGYYDVSEPALLFEPRLFGGVLVHYAEIAITVTEFLT